MDCGIGCGWRVRQWGRPLMELPPLLCFLGATWRGSEVHVNPALHPSSSDAFRVPVGSRHCMGFRGRPLS